MNQMIARRSLPGLLVGLWTAARSFLSPKAEDRHRCEWCGDTIQDGEKAYLDHDLCAQERWRDPEKRAEWNEEARKAMIAAHETIVDQQRQIEELLMLLRHSVRFQEARLEKLQELLRA